MDDTEIAEYIAELKDTTAFVRCNAAVALGQMGDASAVPALIHALQDKDSGVRHNAIVALGNIGDTSAIPALLGAWEYGYGAILEIRWAVVGAMKKIGIPAIPALIEALTDEASAVRQVAAEVLGEIGDASAIPALIKRLEDGPDVRRHSAEAMQDVSQYAAAALGKIGNPALPALINALNDTNAPVRWSAADALGAIGDASAIPALIERLKDEESGVRQGAAKALGKIGDASAVPALIEALTDEDSAVRHEAAEALGAIGDASAVPALIRALKEGGAEALGKIGNSHTLPRKILGAAQFTAEEKVKVLDALRGVSYTKPYLAFYHFPNTRSLCQRVLHEQDIQARTGAQAVLHWLDGGGILVRASQREPASDSEELLRAAQGGTPASQPETLLRGSDPPAEAAEPPQPRRTLRDWLFPKQKDSGR